MKVSVSLPDDDVAFLDDYARTQGFDSRSAVVQRAVALLRSAGLAAEYDAAWREWATSGDADLWDAAAGDGIRSEHTEGASVSPRAPGQASGADAAR